MAKEENISKVVDGVDYFLLTSVEANKHKLKILTVGFVLLCFLCAHDARVNAKKSKKLDKLVEEVEELKKLKGD